MKEQRIILSNIAIATGIALMLLSCTHKNTADDLETQADRLKKDAFELKGTYYWNFKLMGTLQESINTFYADSIVYEMKGKVYSTKYAMQKLSYDQNEKRWIGEDNEKIVYVMFFKNITDSAMLIYKHKCKTEGLQEALDFAYPKPDATQDHGWNLYHKNRKTPAEDEMPFTGNYKAENINLSVTKNEIQYHNKTYRKLSYHPGERRWVGKNEKTDKYLQIFFKPFKPNYDPIYLDIKEYKDLEKAYKTKYKEENNFIKFTKQK